MLDTLGPGLFYSGTIYQGSTLLLGWNHPSIGTSPTGGQGTGTIRFSYSGPTVTLQPIDGSTSNAHTDSSNLPITISGSIEYRVNGVCVWCESFTGTGLLSGNSGGASVFSGGGSVSVNFSGETTVPEPSTWTMMSLAGIGLIWSAARRRR